MKPHPTARARVFVALTLAASMAAACSKIDRQQFADEVQRLTARQPQWVDRAPIGRRLWAIERQFYEARRYLPAWIDGDDPTRQLDELLKALEDSELHGLDPARYATPKLVEERARANEAFIGASFEPSRVPELDVRLTYAFLSYAADLLAWRASARDVTPYWLASPNNDDLAARLAEAIDKNRVRDALDELAPSHPQYKGLQAALARARKEGEQAADGTSSPAWRIQQIRMNLERWRWTPRDLGKRHILINVPAYQMQVVENDKPVLAMRIIVGKPDTPTPLFSDEMTYVVFSPYWNIPEQILREETLPRLAGDPDYLSRNNIEVVRGSGKAQELIDPASVDWSDAAATEDLHFRQGPGPENALGLVKFIFPNHFNVYLHDTPGDALFARPARTFSHGCIRIEKPVALAEYVLRDQMKWTHDRIIAAMNAQQEQAVKLKEPVPVHIGYWTAWVEPDGTVTFTDDPYKLDPAQARLMKPAAPPGKKAD